VAIRPAFSVVAALTSLGGSLGLRYRGPIGLCPDGASRPRLFAARAWYDGLLTQLRTSGLTISDREVFVGGEWATEVAGFEWTLAPVGGGPAVVDRGSYMQLWHREPDGRWRFSRELWNSAAPPAAASKAP
jgi:hypothetical protein